MACVYERSSGRVGLFRGIYDGSQSHCYYNLIELETSNVYTLYYYREDIGTIMDIQREARPTSTQRRHSIYRNA